MINVQIIVAVSDASNAPTRYYGTEPDEIEFDSGILHGIFQRRDPGKLLTAQAKEKATVAMGLARFAKQMDPSAELEDYVSAVDEVVLFNMRNHVKELRTQIVDLQTYILGLSGNIFAKIQHGDAEHRAWLKNELDAFFAQKEKV